MKLWIRDMAIALIIGLLLTQLIKPTIVREHSMEATLQEYDYIILNRQAYLFSEPKVGDIIVFHTDLVQSNGKEKLLIKRVIGLPGDRIFISDGKVYRNGEPLDEPYTLDGYTASEMEEVVVPEDSLFVMGDNRQNSIDSRDSSVGFVSYDSILGKAIIRLYPFNKIGLIR
ncbi:MAG TPA: signal peptidase I [Clostridiales bacterium UBA9856]|jgi:signal peptidase I|nr:signal peptidase I [Clostridiales bacterium UBA9856]HOA43184.1 signal peptidase I [Bacillota bacterium]HPZ60068.1 signal peptidase I [Bacillota bacterium]